MPEAAIRIAIRQIKYTNGVAAPENGVENCGLKNVETAGPMIAADMITAPTGPTAPRRKPTRSDGVPSSGSVIVSTCRTGGGPCHRCRTIGLFLLGALWIGAGR